MNIISPARNLVLPTHVYRTSSMSGIAAHVPALVYVSHCCGAPSINFSKTHTTKSSSFPMFVLLWKPHSQPCLSKGGDSVGVGGQNLSMAFYWKTAMEIRWQEHHHASEWIQVTFTWAGAPRQLKLIKLFQEVIIKMLPVFINKGHSCLCPLATGSQYLPCGWSHFGSIIGMWVTWAYCWRWNMWSCPWQGPSSCYLTTAGLLQSVQLKGVYLQALWVFMPGSGSAQKEKSSVRGAQIATERTFCFQVMGQSLEDFSPINLGLHHNQQVLLSA